MRARDYKAVMAYDKTARAYDTLKALKNAVKDIDKKESSARIAALQHVQDAVAQARQDCA